MIAVDTNVLVYAHRAESAFDTANYAGMQQLAEDGQSWV
jgi:predicted nucleic acid-binding protein